MDSGQVSLNLAGFLFRIEFSKKLLSPDIATQIQGPYKTNFIRNNITRITIWCSVVGDFMQSERKNIFLILLKLEEPTVSKSRGWNFMCEHKQEKKNCNL